MNLLLIETFKNTKLNFQNNCISIDKFFVNKFENGSQANRNSLFLLKNSLKKSLMYVQMLTGFFYKSLYGKNGSEFKVSSLRAIRGAIVNNNNNNFFR